MGTETRNSTMSPPDDLSGNRSGLNRRSFLSLSAVSALGALGGSSLLTACGSSGSGSGGGKGEVVVMAWENYVDPEIQKRFEAKTGIKMRAVTGQSDQDMFTKLQAGGGDQYDIVFANCGFSPTYYKNGLIEAIDLNTISSAKDLSPIFKENTDFPYVVAKNKTMLYPSMWAAFGLIWNTKYVNPTSPVSWNYLWDSSIPKGKTIFQGAGDDFLGIAGLANGVSRKDIYSMSGDTLDAAAQKLIQLKPYQISESSDQVTADAIRTGKAYAGQATSLGLAYRINQKAGTDVAKIQLPSEGALGWVDGPQLVKGAKNRDNAIKFIEFLMGDPSMQDWLWKQNVYGMASQATSKRIMAGGKAMQADVYKSLGGDKPQLATTLVFQGPPDDPAAWAAAYDKVLAA